MSGGGSLALQPYLDCVRATLTAAMCLQNFASQEVERHNKPEVEFRYVSDTRVCSVTHLQTKRRRFAEPNHYFSKPTRESTHRNFHQLFEDLCVPQEERRVGSNFDEENVALLLSKS